MNYVEEKIKIEQILSQCKMQAAKSECVILVKQEISDLIEKWGQLSLILPLHVSPNIKTNILGIEVVIEENLYSEFVIMSRNNYHQMIGYHE